MKCVEESKIWWMVHSYLLWVFDLQCRNNIQLAVCYPHISSDSNYHFCGPNGKPLRIKLHVSSTHHETVYITVGRVPATESRSPQLPQHKELNGGHITIECLSRREHFMASAVCCLLFSLHGKECHDNTSTTILQAVTYQGIIHLNSWGVREYTAG